METSTKNQHQQQKAITSDKRHLPVLVFEIELILSQKQERATKSSKRQRTAAKGNEQHMETRAKNQNEQQKATKSIFHSHFRHSFAPILVLWKVLISRAMKSQKEQRQAAKSNI